MTRKLSSLAALFLAALLALQPLGMATAANLTPDQLSSETSPAGTDLLVIYPSGGPLKNIGWSNAVAAMQVAFGGTFLQQSLNLADLASPSTARNNLGLGTVATLNTGTSGATIPLLNGTNTWANGQTFSGALIFNSTVAVNGLATFVNSDICLLGSSTGCTTFTSANAGASNFTLTFPAITDTVVTSTDSRFIGPTQNGQCTYGLVLSDGGEQIYCNTATTHTLTIPANSSVAFQVVTKIDVVNDCSAGALTIAITTDTLVWFPSGTTGSRTLAACGEATLTKVGTTRWVITGTNLN